MRLQQVNKPNSRLPIPGATVAGAETQGLFHYRDRLLDRAGQELAPAEIGIGAGLVAVELDHGLVFGNSLFASAQLAQDIGLGVMGDRAARQLGGGSGSSHLASSQTQTRKK